MNYALKGFYIFCLFMGIYDTSESNVSEIMKLRQPFKRPFKLSRQPSSEVFCNITNETIYKK
jgi:hypothetical protein